MCGRFSRTSGGADVHAGGWTTKRTTSESEEVYFGVKNAQSLRRATHQNILHSLIVQQLPPSPDESLSANAG
jgi:hypothetical protein